MLGIVSQGCRDAKEDMQYEKEKFEMKLDFIVHSQINTKAHFMTTFQINYDNLFSKYVTLLCCGYIFFFGCRLSY